MPDERDSFTMSLSKDLQRRYRRTCVILGVPANLTVDEMVCQWLEDEGHEAEALAKLLAEQEGRDKNA